MIHGMETFDRKRRMNLKGNSKTNFVLGWGIKYPEPWIRVEEDKERNINLLDKQNTYFCTFALLVSLIKATL